MIHNILSELNESNSTNHKLATLKKYKNDELLKRVLKMTYDNVEFTYGVTVPQVEKFASSSTTNTLTPGTTSLEYALDVLEEQLSTRAVTGRAALQVVSDLLATMNPADAALLKKIINRDLRVNFGKTLIVKVWPSLIKKPVYMRCDVYGPNTSAGIKFPAYVQLKADGTYREFTVTQGVSTSRSRSGEYYEYPVIFEQLSSYPDGVYIGELTVSGVDDRAKGNGMINSDDPPHDLIVLDLWDYVTHEEYAAAGTKDKKNAPTKTYAERWAELTSIVGSSSTGVHKNIRLIDTHVVNSMKEALAITSGYMNAGHEGSVLKGTTGTFKDGTSKQQLKLKLKIDCEMRITGFQEGTPGTKREGKIGSILFENDEGTIKGKTSGFTDEELDEFTSKQDELIGKIITVQFNDLSRAEGNDYYALSHPRFIEIRNDKITTDNLETVLKLREMATEL
jgi:DNA ligase-1